MKEAIFHFLNSFNLTPEAMILFLATLPVTELRASIPIGILVLKESMYVTFVYSILGNLIPIAPIYFFLEPLSKMLSKTKFMRKFFEWLFERAHKRKHLIEKYEALGLMLFVCIPLPGTGVWTGCLIASLLRMRFIPTALAASMGVIIAAILVTTITILVPGVFSR
ncbi:MAG: small multi-drug export protein [Candidatus Omnitrophota bacterium]|jgi:uncharacterized membrane protein|nr:small multi-drug export protein [Candidatus Omnitrophota bacterium]